MPYGGCSRSSRHILDMAGGEGRDLTVWEKANLRWRWEPVAANGLAFAWIDLNEAVAGPADIAPQAVTSNGTVHLTETRAEALRRRVKNCESLRPWQ